MAEHKGAIKIDTKINVDSIRRNFKEIDTKTKNMINQYNRAVDSIKSQELAIQKVKDQIETLQGYKDFGVLKENEAQRLNELNAKLPLLNSKLSETKRITNELGESIKENLNQKASLLGIQKGIDNVGTRLDKFKNKMTRLVGTVMVFNLLRGGLTSLRNKFSELLKTNDEYNSSLNQIKANLMTAFAPIYNACLPAINSLMSALSKLTGTIAVFVSGLFGKNLKQAKKEAQGLSKSLNKVSDSGEKASNSLSSIDEIQNIDDDTSSGGGSGDNGIDYSGEFEYSSKLLDILNKIKKWIEDNQGLVIGAIAGITTALILMRVLGLDPILSLGIGMIIGGIIALIKDLKDYIEDPSWENFGKIIRDIGLIILGVGVVLLKVFGIAVAWPVILAGVIAIIVGLIIKNWDTIKGILIKAWEWIDDKLKYLEEHFGLYGKFIADLIRQLVFNCVIIFKGLFTGFKQILDGIILIFKGDFKNGIKTVMKGIENVFTSEFNFIKLIFTGFINFMIEKINGLTGRISSLGVTLPSWLPMVGGKRLSISIPKIPRLATGTVIPPNSEFAAILGDQKRGVNIETPLSTMIEAFNKALDSRDGGMIVELLIELNRNVLELANRPNVLNVNGKALAQATYQDFQNEGNRLNYSTAIKVK